MAVHLVVVDGGLTGPGWPLRPGEFRLGAASDCVIRLAADGIAPHHATLFVDRTGIQLVPADGAVSVNQQPTAGPLALRPNDLLQLGPLTLQIRNVTVPAARPTSPAATPATPATPSIPTTTTISPDFGPTVIDPPTPVDLVSLPAAPDRPAGVSGFPGGEGSGAGGGAGVPARPVSAAGAGLVAAGAGPVATAGAAPAGADAPLGVALPPPAPSPWRLLWPLLALGVMAAVVTLVIRLVPQRLSAEQQLSAEVREQVAAATVWIRARIPEGESEGSGFVSADGFVLTNAHVVAGGQNITAWYHTGTGNVRRASATILRLGHPGERDDIALLKVDTAGIRPLALAQTGQLATGTPLLAFGYPLGSLVSTSSRGPQISIRRGDLTAVRTNNAGQIEWLESDILAEVGNSGGPVVTLDGRVVGLATMLVGPNLRTARIVPANLLKTFAAGSVTP